MIGTKVMLSKPCPHNTKSLLWVARAQLQHTAVYAHIYRRHFLNVCYFMTARIKFTLPCYFPVTQYHEVFLNSSQTNCIFAALNYLASSLYSFIYQFFILFYEYSSQYTSLSDSTRQHPFTVTTDCIFLCFLSFTGLPLHMRILYFLWDFMSNILDMQVNPCIRVRSPFSICSSADSLFK